ncbi:EAL domain-containing protein [Shewanella decolorationis]|uniref:cyclic-guanylate-specific phosphodiesterase n=1 Tax=Shewanella decolorationis TaxID=256839 RepID=A0A5B8QTU1_9GAMM|nr:EAL domain-containing protein [Shewanella decolorationis]QDZ89509.1 EAL domain-containing protein [Shewanella decolorationis]
MKKIIIHFILPSMLLVCLSLQSAWAGSFVQRVFTDRDGLEATSIRALTLDDHGFVWAATEQGLYRVSNSKVRRIDKTGSELRLADEFLTTVINVDRDMLLLSTNAATYLYDIAKNQFIQMGSPNLFPHFPGGVLLSAARKNTQEWRLLIDNGQIYDFSPSKLTLTLVNQLPVNRDLPWRKLLSMPDGQFLVAGQFQLLLLNGAGEKVVDYQWTEPMGSILDMLEDSKQRIWIATSRGIYRLEPKTLQIFPVPELPDWSTAMVEGHNGEIWFSSRAGLLKWSPDTHQIENYQQELKTQANMETLKAILFDNAGLMWVGGSGDGLALLASQPDFILDTYTSEPPYGLPDPMVWSVFASDEGLWFGASNLSFVGKNNQKAVTVEIDGLKAHESIYGISQFIEHYLLVSTTSGLFVVDKLTLKGMSFSQWAHGSEEFKNKLIYSTYVDPKLKGRFWIATGTGLYFWEQGLFEPQPFNIDGSTGDSPEPKRPTIRTLYRASDGKLWLGGRRVFGFIDEQNLFHDKRGFFSGLSSEPSISHIEEISPGVMWFGSYERGLFEYRLNTAELISLTSQWQVNCNSVFFIQKTTNANVVACADSLIRQDTSTGHIAMFNQLDGLISNEMNEGAYFYSAATGLYIGTPEGVMHIDVDKLSNRITDDHVMLESVSVYYDDNTQVSLLPKPMMVIKPGANMVSLQITNLDYLDDSPIQFKYRLRYQGEEDNYVLLQGESQINLAGLAAGEYVLEVLSQENGIWSDKPFAYPFYVEQYWWLSQGFKGILLLVFSTLALSLAWYRQRQVRTFMTMNQALTESDDRLRQSLRGSDSDLWEWHRDTQSFYLDNRGSVLGSHANEIVVSLEELPVHSEDRDKALAQWNSMLAGEIDRFEAEYRYQRRDGNWGWLRVRGRPVQRNKQTKVIERVAGIYSDITLQRQLEDEVSLLAQAFENTSEGVLILDVNENIRVANHAAQHILGSEQKSLVGLSFSQFVQMKDGLSTEVAQLLGQDSSWTGERELVGQNGLVCPVWLNVSVMQSVNENALHYVVVFSDITDRKRTEADLRRLANYDVLTGLPNRSLFSNRLTQAIQTAQQHGQKLALLFLDLDRFKHVNDSYGHSMGDALLVEASNRLQSCIGSEHLLCRFGGDEFVILLKNVKELDDINHLAEQLLAQIVAPFRLFGREFYISTSIGISIWPDDAIQPEAFIKNADLAMYHAKEEGRGNFKYYSSERNAQALYHLRLEADLRKAIEREEFELHYQPQIDILRGDKFIGMEALIRWRHPVDGFVRPDIFIKVAEACGLVVDIDRWVLRTACLDGARWAKAMTQPFKLSVNISAVHFRQPDFIDGVKKILSDTGMPAASLCLEITEGVLMKELQVAKTHLKQLDDLGIEVAIDDFGTGYSSLAYLRNFEVDTLKIDRSFLIDIASNAADQAIVSSIIELARNLKLNVVAEGVETVEQLEQIFSRGCYIIQGYYFAKPMPVCDFEKYLQQQCPQASLQS